MDVTVESLSPSNFSKMCRTCLNTADAENFASVFNVQYNECSLIEILNMCTTIQIEQDDELPLLVCTRCISEAIRSYDFKIQCEQSDIKLKQALQHENNTATLKENIYIKNDLKDELEECCSDESCSNYSWTKHNTPPIQGVKSKKIGKKVKPNPPYECCSETFDTYSKYLMHRKQNKHSRPRNHACIYCNKLFTFSQLQQHLRSHTLEKPYACQICQQRFSLNCNLRRHMMTHTGERPHQCKECGKGFIQSTSLTEHMRIHNGGIPFICSYCGKSFKQSVSLRSHMKLHQKEKDENDKVKSCDYQCPTCLRMYATKTVLKTHMLIHIDKKYLCSHCGKVFARRAGLQSHSKVHTGAKPYTCLICDKKFSQLGSMKSHHLIHTGEKPYVCNMCGRAFTQKPHLKYHQRTHSGEKPYKCSVCGKSFAINGTLTVHMRTHTGETPFVCCVCGKGFYDSSSMKKHKKGHGEIELIASVVRRKEPSPKAVAPL